MAAYSERAGRGEERDIKEREATAEKGGGRLLKFTAVVITALVNQVRSSPSALLANTTQSSGLLALCIRLNNPRGNSTLLPVSPHATVPPGAPSPRPPTKSKLHRLAANAN